LQFFRVIEQKKRVMKNIVYCCFLILGLAAPAAAENGIPRHPSAPGAKVQILSPVSGATVQSPFTVRFGLSGMGVAPAGVAYPNTGHHHLILDSELPAMDAPIPADEHHIHYGKGQTEAVIELPPGTHTLQLVLGDLNHVPHDPPVISDPITITVE
jgi:hypothetical protein